MEGKLNDLPQTRSDVGASGGSTENPSKTQLVEYDSDSNISSPSTRPESNTRGITHEVVELSSDDDVEIVDIKAQKGAKTPEHGQEQHLSGRSSPKDLTCSVCLSEYDNKAFLDKCFHAFCYFCILQWSEIVRTCPLCKSSFSSIIHSVKSMDNYQQHYLSNPDVHAPMIQQQSQSDGRRFRYRTTLAEGNRQQQQRNSQNQQVIETDPWEQRARRRQARIAAQRDRKAIGRERRRTIYSSNLWVQGVTQEGRARQRKISPEFFRINPACSHRLIPWLTRDLRVLLNDYESHVDFVLQLILSLITKVELRSDEFRRQLQPFLFGRTEHFIHEFTSFAQSPFDVTAYDERAQYNWPNEARDQVRDTPTVFHSQTSGWQTPVPGPSGESMLELFQTDWSRDSPVVQRESTSWSPSSSPGTSGLNGQLSLAEIVTISSASSHNAWTNAGRSMIDEIANEPVCSVGSSNKTRSKSESVTDETEESSREQTHNHPHNHRHRHSRKHKHRHKHKQKDSKRRKTKQNANEQSQVTESLDNALDQSGSKQESSVSGTPTAEVIVVSSDSNTSPSVSRMQNRASPIDLTMRRRNTKGSVSRSRSRSKSVAKGKRIAHNDNRSRHVESCPSRDRSRSTGERTRKHSHPSRSRSRSQSRFKERHRSKGKRRLESDDHNMSKSEMLFSKRQSLKENHHRAKKQSRSRSRGRSRSRTRAKTPSKTRSEKLDKRTAEYSRSRTTSDSSLRNEAPSSSRNSRSRRSRSRHSRSRRSRSRNSQSRNSRSRSRSRSKRFSLSHSARSSRSHVDFSRGSHSRKSTQLEAHSNCNPKKLNSDSDEDIKKEIEDLEYRITTDKKRLLKLLIKQEREKAVDVTELEDETSNEPGARDECQS